MTLDQTDLLSSKYSFVGEAYNMLAVFPVER